MTSHSEIPSFDTYFLTKGSDEQLRISDQLKRLASMVPSTKEHRIATNVLLLLQDSAHMLVAARVMLQEAREMAECRRADVRASVDYIKPFFSS